MAAKNYRHMDNHKSVLTLKPMDRTTAVSSTLTLSDDKRQLELKFDDDTGFFAQELNQLKDIDKKENRLKQKQKTNTTIMSKFQEGEDVPASTLDNSQSTLEEASKNNNHTNSHNHENNTNSHDLENNNTSPNINTNNNHESINHQQTDKANSQTNLITSSKAISNNNAHVNLITSPKITSSNIPFYPLVQPITSQKIGLSHLPDQSMRYYKQQGTSFTLMVAGSSGSGKTTFLNSLFASDLIESTGSTKALEIHRYELIEDDFLLHFTAIDTPGFGGQIDNSLAWFPLCRFIDQQFTTYLFQNEQPYRAEIVDERVHCCIYFIEPSVAPLKPLDIAAMKALSGRVNLIPVISKGDALCEGEIKRYREIIRRTLEYHGIAVCNLVSDPLFQQYIKDKIPFLVGGSTKTCSKKPSEKSLKSLEIGKSLGYIGKLEIGKSLENIGKLEIGKSLENIGKLEIGESLENIGKLEIGESLENIGKLKNNTTVADSFIRGREYKWGVFELENPNHCDFSELRKILLDQYALELIASTDVHFDTFRARCLERRLEEQENSNIGEDGLSQFINYNKIGFEEYEAIALVDDPYYEAAKQKMIQRLDEEVAQRERFFKKWKSELIEEQSQMNQSIRIQHEELLALQKEVDELGNHCLS